MRFVMVCLSLLTLFLFGGAVAVHAAEKTYTNSIGMEFVLIPAGDFLMGSDKSSETPQHRVSISKSFYMGKYEVTQAQWETVMGRRRNLSEFKGRTNPVEQVSWGDIKRFIWHLNKQEGHNRYRLPTEAEWEYAARAGSNSTYFFGDSRESLGRYAWYSNNSERTTHPVGQKEANAWGLYDIYGNVEEWVQDWYGEYSASSVTDPRGPSSGSYRVVRGGDWSSIATDCRSSSRSFSRRAVQRGEHFDVWGFRLALSLE
jgi:formylglycine-generating enzyme required for sulfatase activity